MAELAFKPRDVLAAGDLSTLATQYLQRLANRGRSPNTVAAYKVDLEQFVGYLGSQAVTLVQVVNRRHVEGFVDALMLGERVSARTAFRKLETVRGFFRYAVLEGLVPERANPCLDVPSPKYEAGRVIAPETEIIEAFLLSLPSADKYDLRDRAAFMLMYSAALRVSGLLSLDLYDPAKPPQCCVEPSGTVNYLYKGNRIKESFCDAATLAALDDYLKVRGEFKQAQYSPALFVGHSTPRLCRHALHVRIKRHAAGSTIPHLHMHLLRHGRARAVRRNVGLKAASWLLGHKNEAITENVYGHEMSERTRADIAALAPVKLKVAA